MIDQVLGERNRIDIDYFKNGRISIKERRPNRFERIYTEFAGESKQRRRKEVNSVYHVPYIG